MLAVPVGNGYYLQIRAKRETGRYVAGLLENRGVAYAFRLRFKLGPSQRINHSESELVLATEPCRVLLRSRGADRPPIEDASDLLLIGHPYETSDEAMAAGERWRTVLSQAFAHCIIGADFGDRTGVAVVTQHALDQLAASMEQPVLNDVHGLMTFETDPWPRFAGMEPVNFVVGRSSENLKATLDRATASGHPPMSDAEKISYSFFAASILVAQVSADARLLMLMSAVEALLERKPRSGRAQAQIDSLVAATKKASLPDADLESLLKAMETLRIESVGRAGRRLAKSLRPRRYLDEDPVEFFNKAYEIRSLLAHGADPPDWNDVNQYGGAMELFVRDLLSGTLHD